MKEFTRAEPIKPVAPVMRIFIVQIPEVGRIAATDNGPDRQNSPNRQQKNKTARSTHRRRH